MPASLLHQFLNTEGIFEHGSSVSSQDSVISMFAKLYGRRGSTPAKRGVRSPCRNCAVLCRRSRMCWNAQSATADPPYAILRNPMAILAILPRAFMFTGERGKSAIMKMGARSGVSYRVGEVRGSARSAKSSRSAQRQPRRPSRLRPINPAKRIREAAVCLPSFHLAAA